MCPIRMGPAEESWGGVRSGSPDWRCRWNPGQRGGPEADFDPVVRLHYQYQSPPVLVLIRDRPCRRPSAAGRTAGETKSGTWNYKTFEIVALIPLARLSYNIAVNIIL